MDFSKKSISELGEWLKEEHFSEEIVELFKEQEIDGETFMELPDDQVKMLVPKIGPQTKMLKRRNAAKRENGTIDLLNHETTVPNHFENEGMYDSVNPLFNEFQGFESDDHDSYTDMTSEEVFTTNTQTLTSPTHSTHCEPKEKLEVGKRMKMEIVSKRAQEKPLPRPFMLPTNFQPHIVKALREKKVVGRTRAKFVTAIAEAVYLHKSYPTKEEWEHVALQAVKKWEFLGRHGALAQDLSLRMNYIRKPDGKKRGKGKAKSGKIETTKVFPQVPKTLPSASYEDKPAFERHVKRLGLEFKRGRTANKEVTKELMNKTFLFRHEEIQTNSLSLSDLFLKYPPLKDADEIVRELERIEGRELATIQQWEIILPKIIQVAKGHLELEIVQIELGAQNLDFITAENNTILGLFCLYYMLSDTRYKADHQRVLIFAKDDEEAEFYTTQPCLILEGLGARPAPKDHIIEAKLVVEKNIVATFPAKLSPIVLLSAFYAFNLSWTEGCVNFYSFLEYFFMKKKRDPKRTKLNRLCAELNI